MNLREQEYICKIAELGSFSKAAKELYISQSALSHYVSNVEKSLGAELFDRATSPVSLTAAGVCYVSTARQIIELHKNMENRIKLLARQETIHLGMSHTLVTYLFPQVLRDFSTEHKLVNIKLLEASVAELEEKLITRKIDIAIFPLQNVSDKCIGIPIYKEHMLLITQKGYLDPSCFNPDGSLHWEHILSLPWVLMKEGHRQRDLFNKIYTHYKRQQINIIMETANSDTICRLVRDGAGIALISDFVLNNVHQSEEFDIYSLKDMNLSWDMGFVRHRQHMLTAAEKDLLDIFYRVCSQTAVSPE